MPRNPSIVDNPGLDQWLELTDDQRIIIHTGKVDIGQRVSTALAIIAAEELDVNYDQIEVKRTETGVDPNEGYTAGSLSIQNSGGAIRRASATARRHMLKLASEKLDVKIDTLVIENGLIQSRKTNRSVTYWDLMAGKRFGIDIDQLAIVKAPEYHTKVGRKFISKGIFEIVTGEMTYIHDIDMPNMLHARLIRPPNYGAKLERIDESVLKRLRRNGTHIIRDGSFLAVASVDEYKAVKAAARLSAAAKWNMENGIVAGDLYTALTSNKRISLPVGEGGAPLDEPVVPMGKPPEGAVTTLSARFEKPYHMHGSIGPSAGCAIFKDGQLKVWTHSQGVYPLRGAMAEALNMAPEDIHIIFMPGAGCYGHNGADDAAFESALVACTIPNTPILLKWTRDDEHAWEPYGSAMVCVLRGSLDSKGKIIDWSHESYGDTFVGRPGLGPPGSSAKKLVSTHYLSNSLDWPIPQPAMGAHIGIHRNLEPFYTITEPRLVKNLVRDLPLRTSSLRTLGAFGNVVAIEAFMDELAQVGGVSPTEFRISHLKDNRAREVVVALDQHMKQSDAGSGENSGCGIAFSRYKNIAAYCAVGIELEVLDSAEVKLQRAWVSVDAGEIVDPEGLIAQLEGGLIQAASWTLYEEVTYDSTGITSRNWDDYPIIRFDNIPLVETIMINRPGSPFLGAGEAVAGPTGGAIANAIFDAIGLRIRRMPFNSENIRKAALEG